jgi:uncharacterized membrane protein SirB2
MLQGILHEEPSFWAFVMISILIGGWTAWRTGKSVADGWGEIVPHVVIYVLLLGIAVRFIHHALFDATMFTAQYYFVDTIVLLAIGVLGYKYTRTNQMVTQYNWLYERTSLLGWKARS